MRQILHCFMCGATKVIDEDHVVYKEHIPGCAVCKGTLYSISALREKEEA